jgi:hypothetical protein
MRARAALLGLAAAAAVLAADAGPRAADADAATPPCPPLTRFNPLDFPERPTAGSRLLPLVPGDVRVLTGRSNVSGSTLPHTVTFTVTDLTKVIAGVRTVAVHDVDISNGVIAEEELAFFAEDRFGNVWNLGEYPEEHAGGFMVGAPSTWLAGVDGAIPGIHAPARTPEVDSPPYLQGYVPPIDFLDCAQTFAVGATSCVPAGCFTGVTITDETSPLDPAGGSQRKHYAPGVGIVEVGAVDDPQAETLVLTRREQLSPAELDVVRERSLALDRRGREMHPVYRTAPAVEAPLLRTPAALGSSDAPTRGEARSRRRRAAGRVSLRLVGGPRRATPAGRVGVRVRCAVPSGRVTARPGPCRGRLELRVRGARTAAGATRFRVPGGTERVVRVQLGGSALRRLRRTAIVTLAARTRAATAAGRPASASTTLTVRPA